MGKTVRSGGYVPRPKLLKLDDKYTGYLGEETWKPDAKRQAKRRANKANRRAMKYTYADYASLD
jgi:hypothetical protein